ncbi:MAG: exopolysaccharide biosynthesis polyprenyl glycosylphosphotransferase [Candidatus Moranbacteria bacterium]|nr:exopolysaccharide biosynthesis polyprenyl glycosylphosphotransferase [Candidatus Moranbacteria bacterium]
MKKSEIFFNVILVPIDYFLIVISVLLAYYIRSHPVLVENYFVNPIVSSMGFIQYLNISWFIAFFVIVVFAFEGLYSMAITRSKLREIYKIFVATSTALLILIITLFFNRELLASRFIILAAWFLVIFLTSLARVVIRYIQKWLVVNKKIGIHKVLLIGDNRISKIVKGYFKKNPGVGYKIIGRLGDEFNWERLKEINEKKGIDEIIQCDPLMHKKKVNMLVRFSDIYKMDFKYIPNLFQSHATNVSVRQLAGLPLIELQKTPLEGWGRVIKRVFDIIFSLTFITVFSWLYILIAVLIKLDSKGPILFKDYRCGYRKRKFIFYKFRSLKADLCDGEFGTKKGNKLLKQLEKDQGRNTRKGSPLHKIKNDPRVTRVGRFIRRYSLDEIPAFFNVFKGDMSVVGYRPHMSYEVEKYSYDQQRMFYIKPGITGLAQISGRSDLNFDQEVSLDVYYMENWSLLMDIAIILKTPGAVFRKRKVE